MRFHVLGLGPIGSLVSHHLRRTLPPTHSISLIHKNERYARAAQEKGGIVSVERDGLVSAASGFKSEIFSSPMYIPELPSSHASQANTDEDGSSLIESLFITTKAYTTLSAITKLLPRLSHDSTIVLLQNGMGMYEELVQSLFRNPLQRPHFILASNTHGAYLRGPTDVVHTGAGEIKFGIVPDPSGRNFEAGFFDDTIPVTERRARLGDITAPTDPTFARYKSLRNTVAALLLAEPLNTSWLPIAHIQTAMRLKLVVNAVINPLTAIMNCRNGDIFATNAARQVMRRVCVEASLVYAAEMRANAQVMLQNASAAGYSEDDVILDRLPRSLTASALEQECLRVAELTKGNISSMLSDVRRGNPTEIDYMNGYLLNLAQKYRVLMPVTMTLAQLVHMRSDIPLDQMF